MKFKLEVLVFLLLLSLSGCSVSNRELQLEGDRKVAIMQDLLRQGWELSVHDGKVLLIKNTPEGLLVEDVFGVIESEDLF